MFRKQIAFGAVVAMVAFAGSAKAEESAAEFFRNDATIRIAFLQPEAQPQQALPTTTKVVVADPTGESKGVITVDTKSRHLYLSLGDGKALQYGVGVGRAGFEWSGQAHVGRKAEWPEWTPPAAMRDRQPNLPLHMAGGIDNPLGARALYLYSGNRDLMYRIHGTNDASSIGKAMSSGCIRMLNADVEDLYAHVPVGAKVIVL